VYDALPWSGGCAHGCCRDDDAVAVPADTGRIRQVWQQCCWVCSSCLLFVLEFKGLHWVEENEVRVANLCVVVVVVVVVVLGLPPLCCAPPAVGFSITLKGISKIISSVGKFKIEKYPKKL